jgi:hypothetical protein
MESRIGDRKNTILLVSLVVVMLGKLLLSGRLLPNFELVIPVIIVFGCFSNSWKFPVIVLPAVAILDVLGWGFSPVYIFTWSGFIICWLFLSRRAFNPFSSTPRIIRSSLMATLKAILLFDVYTAFWCWPLWYPRTLAGLLSAYFNQIPFTLYHLLSLVFVPPLAIVGKRIIRVPMEMKIPVSTSAKVGVVR